MIQADHRAVQTREAIPRHGSAGFHGHAGTDGVGHDGFAVFIILLEERFHAGHGDDARGDAVLGKLGLRAQHLLHLGAAGHEQHVGRAVAIGQDVAALEAAAAAMVILRQALAGKHQAGGQAGGDGRQPGGGGFLAVGGANHLQIGDGAQAGQLLHGLVGSAVLANADGIVREHIGDGQLHDGAHADGVLHVIAEHKERAAEHTQAAVQSHAVADGRHGMLAHAKVHVAAGAVFGAVIAAVLDVGVVGGSQVGAAAHQVGQALGQAVDHRAAGGAGGDAAVILPQLGIVHQPFGQLLVEPGVVFLFRLGILFGIAQHQVVPFGFALLAALGALGQVSVHIVVHAEGALGHAQGLLHGQHVIIAQGRAVAAGGALLGGAAVADDGLADDQRGAIVAAGLGDSGKELLHIVAIVYLDYLPAVGGKAHAHVLTHGDVGVALDGDIIVIVQERQLAQLHGAGQGGSLAGNAFHHAAVAAEGVYAVIHHGKFRLVELGGQHGFGDGEAHGVGDALTQRAGGGFHAGGVAIFGMAGGLAAPLAEVLQIIHRQAVAEQVQQGVEQGAGVTVGKDEAVAVLPLRILGVVAHGVGPHGISHGGHAHGRAGMAGIGLLHGIHGQGADGIDRLLLNVHHKRSFNFCSDTRGWGKYRYPQCRPVRKAAWKAWYARRRARRFPHSAAARDRARTGAAGTSRFAARRSGQS